MGSPQQTGGWVVRRALAVLSLALLLVASGCAQFFENPNPTVPEGGAPPSAEPGEPIGEVLDRWETERNESRPTGLAASMALRGNLTVSGEDGLTARDLEPPVVVRPTPAFPSEEPLVYVQNASVEGRGEGLLVVRGEHVEMEGGEVTGVAVARIHSDDAVTLHPPLADVTDEPDRPAVPADTWEGAADSAGFVEFVGASLSSVRLSNYSRAVLVRGNETTELDGPLTVSATGLWMHEGSTVRAGSTRVVGDRFSVVAPDASGTVRVEEREDVTAPRSVFGHGGPLLVEPGRVRTPEGFQFRQAMTDDGLALPAEVEVLPTRTRVTVASGDVEWIRVWYRERSYVGDAVLANATVSGPGSDLVEVQLERPPPHVLQVIRAIRNSSAPNVSIALMAPGLVAVGITDAVRLTMECILVDCPEQRPYPSWMYAGETGRFYYRVNATTAEPGTYDATVRIEGENYDTVTVPVNVTVTEPTTDTEE